LSDFVRNGRCCHKRVSRESSTNDCFRQKDTVYGQKDSFLQPPSNLKLGFVRSLRERSSCSRFTSTTKACPLPFLIVRSTGLTCKIEFFPLFQSLSHNNLHEPRRDLHDSWAKNGCGCHFTRENVFISPVSVVYIEINRVNFYSGGFGETLQLFVSHFGL
jgi:hypothetical protein